MTPELFSDAMNEIGAKYVEEALTYKRPAQRSFWSKLAKRAAMVALVALLALSGFAAASPAAAVRMKRIRRKINGSLSRNRLIFHVLPLCYSRNPRHSRDRGYF